MRVGLGKKGKDGRKRRGRAVRREEGGVWERKGVVERG